MPTGLVRPARQALAADQLPPAARAMLQEVLADLRARIESPEMPPRRFSLEGLDEDGKAAVADILGEGDIWAKVGVGETFCRIVESVMPGVWRLESSTADGDASEWIEVGAVPQPILQAAPSCRARRSTIPRTCRRAR